MKLDSDTIVLFANIFLAFVSGIGAYKSLRYYNKSKHISIYAQTNIALGELNEMLLMLPEALAAFSIEKKGYSPKNTIRDIGIELANHFNEIMSSIPSDYSKQFSELEKVNHFDVPKYINSMIDGTAIVWEGERKTLSRSSFDDFQESLRNMQVFLKQKISEEEERLK